MDYFDFRSYFSKLTDFLRKQQIQLSLLGTKQQQQRLSRKQLTLLFTSQEEITDQTIITFPETNSNRNCKRGIKRKVYTI